MLEYVKSGGKLPIKHNASPKIFGPSEDSIDEAEFTPDATTVPYQEPRSTNDEVSAKLLGSFTNASSKDVPAAEMTMPPAVDGNQGGF